jgi:hypothetical protein
MNKRNADLKNKGFISDRAKDILDGLDSKLLEDQKTSNKVKDKKIDGYDLTGLSFEFGG